MKFKLFFLAIFFNLFWCGSSFALSQEEARALAIVKTLKEVNDKQNQQLIENEQRKLIARTPSDPKEIEKGANYFFIIFILPIIILFLFVFFPSKDKKPHPVTQENPSTPMFSDGNAAFDKGKDYFRKFLEHHFKNEYGSEGYKYLAMTYGCENFCPVIDPSRRKQHIRDEKLAMSYWLQFFENHLQPLFEKSASEAISELESCLLMASTYSLNISEIQEKLGKTSLIRAYQEKQDKRTKKNLRK